MHPPPEDNPTRVGSRSGPGSLPATDPGTTAGRRTSEPEADTEATRVPTITRAVPRPGAMPDVPGCAVRRELARGGMGVVYLAHDPTFDREVAVKVMHAGQDVSRFVIEARVTARLPHPGVPPVYRLGKLPDGRPFLAMKLIQGRTLGQELREADRAAELPRLLGAFERICETVGFAHSKGIIHRDLKPANVMIGAFGEVQVMDWGLAKHPAAPAPKTAAPKAAPKPAAPPAWEPVEGDVEVEETLAGEVKGTPAYMAPEQARGEKVDARADVFALGGILAAILTGKAPFAGNTLAETVERAAAGDLDEAFERLDGCDADPELVALAKRALAPDAADRFADGKELADAVTAYRAGVEERLRAAERERAVSAAEAREQRKRRKVQLALAAAVALVLLAGCGFAWSADRRAREKQRTAEQARRGAVAARELAADLCKQYKYAAARGTLAQAAELAAAGAPDLVPDIERFRNDLELVIEADAIRYRKWRDSPGERARRESRPPGATAPPEYRRAFAARGLDVAALEPAEVARRVATSELKAELVAALDDWAAFNEDKDESRRLLALARELDPDPLRDRVRARELWDDKAAVAALAAAPEVADLPPGVLCLLSFLLETNDLDPRPLLAVARSRHPSDFQLAFVQGRAHGLKGDFRGMLAPYEAARALRPDNATAWNNLAAALSHSGDKPGARETLRAAVARNPGDHILRYNLGLVLIDTGDPAGARDQFAESARLAPDRPETYLDYGRALADTGDRTGAIAAYRTAVRLDPTFGKAWNNLAIELGDQGDRAGARAALAEAVKYEPNTPEVFFTQGLVLGESGDHAGAVAAFRQSLRLRPGHPETLSNLANSLLSAGEPGAALAAVREAVRSDPKKPALHFNLGVILGGTGDADGELAAYREALRLDPGFKEAHRNLTQTLQAKGDADAALAAARAAVKADPGWGTGHFILGTCLYLKGDKRGAADAFRQCTKLEPTNVEAFSNLGGVLSDLGDAPGAIAALREALRLNPKLGPVHLNLGTVYGVHGEWDQAIPALREGVKYAPENLNGHLKLLAALRNKGDRRGAAEAYKAALAAHPKVAQLHNGLGEMLFLLGDKPGCLAAWEEAVKLDPGLLTTRLNLASEYNNAQQFAKVIPHARAAIKADPKRADAHALLGAALANTGDPAGGRAALTEAARLDPKYEAALKQLPREVKPK